jgi:uncharacterized caspase-like protein
MFTRAIVCFFVLLCAGAAFAEEAKTRVALVIGNAAYRRAALANPVNDAKLMAERLKAQGFEVFASYDAGQRDMKRAVQSFSATLRERGAGVVAFIFYAGHGVQVKGENYLIPVDEHIESEGDVDIDAVSLSAIMSMLENTQTQLAIVVLDACRVNPFGYARGGERGLARVDAPSGSLVAFSTAPGKAAQDGAGANSLYTAALAQAMAEPGLKIEEVFKKVRIAVREKTKGEQTPWESTSLTGDFYPAGKGAVRASGHPEGDSQQSSELAKRLQQTLLNYGCYHGQVDGNWNSDAEQALALFARENGRELEDLKPSVQNIMSVESGVSAGCPSAEQNNSTNQIGGIQCVPQYGAQVLSEPDRTKVHPDWKPPSEIGTSWGLLEVQIIANSKGRYLYGKLISPRGGYQKWVYGRTDQWSCR